jgi:hypothetical protein
MSKRTDALADRLEQGARALAVFASALTEAEWRTRVPKDGRKVGVIVHHVATVYPLEIQLARAIAGGNPVGGRAGIPATVVSSRTATTPCSTTLPSFTARRWRFSPV